MIKVPTCFKSPDNPEAISLLLTNSVRSFQNSCALETGLSDFHKMTVTVLKSYLEKKQPKIISYREFLGKFWNNDFRAQILRKFSTLHLSNNSPFLDLHVYISLRALDIYAPKKKKYLRGNSSPFMNDAMSKAVIGCTWLRDKFLKNRSAENKLAYNHQRNYCVPLTRKSKRDYNRNLDNRNATDKKLFWKTVKLFFFDKDPMRQKITLIKITENNNKETSEIFKILSRVYLPC